MLAGCGLQGPELPSGVWRAHVTPSCPREPRQARPPSPRPPCSTPVGPWAAPPRGLASAPAAESLHRPRQQPQVQGLRRLSPGKRCCSHTPHVPLPGHPLGPGPGRPGEDAAAGSSPRPVQGWSRHVRVPGSASCDQSLCPHLEARVAGYGADLCRARASCAERSRGPRPKCSRKGSPTSRRCQQGRRLGRDPTPSLGQGRDEASRCLVPKPWLVGG